MMIGSHLIKSWSTTQKSIALSSGEAELIAAVKLSTEIIGLTQLAADWGNEYQGRLNVDSSAAIGSSHRQGNGKMRHVKVGTFWIQGKIEEGELKMDKVPGEENPADGLTKGVNGQKLAKYMDLTSQVKKEGRAEQGLKLKETLDDKIGSWADCEVEEPIGEWKAPWDVQGPT